MNVEIINNPLQLDLHGLSGVAIGKDHAGTAFKLMDKMWQVVKTNNLKNKGLNILVYEPNGKVFAGVELEDLPSQDIGLERKQLTLEKYSYYKHIGPYNLIKKMGVGMIAELNGRGLRIIPPYIEIYGHWTNDETTLETELIMAIE